MHLRTTLNEQYHKCPNIHTESSGLLNEQLTIPNNMEVGQFMVSYTKN